MASALTVNPTGMVDAFLVLKRTVVLEGCTLRVAVRVAGRHVERIENHALVYHLSGTAMGSSRMSRAIRSSSRLSPEIRRRVGLPDPG